MAERFPPGSAAAVARSPAVGAGRRVLTALARILLAALLLWLLWRTQRLDVGALARRALGATDVAAVIAGAVAVMAGQCLMAVRLRWLLTAHRLPVSFARTLGLTLIGSLSGAVLPGLVGGDAVKAAYLLPGLEGCRTRALSALLLDRWWVLLALFLLGSVALLGGALGWALPARGSVLLVAPLLLGLMVLLPFACARLLRPDRGPRRLRPFVELLQMVAAQARDPRAMALPVFLSLLNHVLVITTYVAAGRLVGDACTWHQHLVLDPLAMVWNAVPLTPGGLGLAEGAFAFLYAAAGSTHGAAVGLLGRLIQTAVFTLGGVPALLLARQHVRPVPARAPVPSATVTLPTRPTPTAPPGDEDQPMC